MKAQEIQNSEHMLSPTHSSSLLNTPIETFHTTRKSSPRLQSSPGQKTSVKEHKSADTGEIQAKDISFEPAVVDLDQLEKQIQQDLRFVLHVTQSCLLEEQSSRKDGVFDNNFSSLSSKLYVVTPHQNHLIEVVQMRGHNICFKQN